MPSPREEGRGLPEWQPIETAPKDGKVFLGLIDETTLAGTPWWFIAAWDESRKRWSAEGFGRRKIELTHWMPLPLPPPK